MLCLTLFLSKLLIFEPELLRVSFLFIEVHCLQNINSFLSKTDKLLFFCRFWNVHNYACYFWTYPYVLMEIWCKITSLQNFYDIKRNSYLLVPHKTRIISEINALIKLERRLHDRIVSFCNNLSLICHPTLTIHHFLSAYGKFVL